MHTILRLSLVLLIALTAHAEKPFASIHELRASMNGDVDAFWNRVLAHRTMPLIFGNDVVFLWRGAAESVEWRGDFSSWQASPATPGKRLGKSDVWIYE